MFFLEPSLLKREILLYMFPTCSLKSYFTAMYCNMVAPKTVNLSTTNLANGLKITLPTFRLRFFVLYRRQNRTYCMFKFSCCLNESCSACLLRRYKRSRPGTEIVVSPFCQRVVARPANPFVCQFLEGGITVCVQCRCVPTQNHYTSLAHTFFQNLSKFFKL